LENKVRSYARGRINEKGRNSLKKRITGEGRVAEDWSIFDRREIVRENTKSGSRGGRSPAKTAARVALSDEELRSTTKAFLREKRKQKFYGKE